MYIERTLSKAINDATETFPVVLVTGPRQVGKTTSLPQQYSQPYPENPENLFYGYRVMLLPERLGDSGFDDLMENMRLPM